MHSQRLHKSFPSKVVPNDVINALQMSQQLMDESHQKESDCSACFNYQLPSRRNCTRCTDSNGPVKLGVSSFFGTKMPRICQLAISPVCGSVLLLRLILSSMVSRERSSGSAQPSSVSPQRHGGIARNPCSSKSSLI